jgi:predicted RNA binding protein YcfA (HicA-like mRNA interferase family)
MKPRQLLDRAARGDVRNVRFADLQRLVEALGFRLERVRGSHHTYRHPDVRVMVNLPSHGRQAKPYQVRQVVDLAARYALAVEDDA